MLYLKISKTEKTYPYDTKQDMLGFCGKHNKHIEASSLALYFNAINEVAPKIVKSSKKNHKIPCALLNYKTIKRNSERAKHNNIKKNSEDTSKMVVHLYTDGGCKYNGKPYSKGGWAFLIVKDNQVKFRQSGSKTGTTNNEMELTAIIKGLEKLQNAGYKGYVVVHSDSQYAVKGLRSWLFKWKENGWKTSSGSAVKNLELWKTLWEFFNTHKFKDLSFQWVEGHSGDKFNELADEMCNNIINKEQ